MDFVWKTFRFILSGSHSYHIFMTTHHSGENLKIIELGSAPVLQGPRHNPDSNNEFKQLQHNRGGFFPSHIAVKNLESLFSSTFSSGDK